MLEGRRSPLLVLAIALRLSYGFLSSMMALEVFHMVKTRRRQRWRKVALIWSVGTALFVCQFFFGHELIQNLPLDFLLGVKNPFLYLFGEVIADTAFRFMALLLSLMSLVEFVVFECLPRKFLNL